MALDFEEGRRVSVPLGMEAFGLAFSEAAARRALENFQRLVASVAGIDEARVRLVAEALSTSRTFNSFAEISAGAAPMSLATSQTALAAFWRAQIARLMDAPKEAAGVDVAREAGRLAIGRHAVQTRVRQPHPDGRGQCAVGYSDRVSLITQAPIAPLPCRRYAPGSCNVRGRAG